MEPSKTYGGIEECHSSESGWTTYIGFSLHGGDDGHGEKGAVVVDDDDDSMASDASSGPRHQGHGTSATLSFKHDEEEDDDEDERGCFLDKKGKKSMEKQKPGSMKNKQEVQKQTPLKAKRALSDPCRTGSKLRQSIRFGKRN